MNIEASIEKVIGELIYLNNDKGYITYSDIDNTLPDDIISEEQIEIIVNTLEELNIMIQDDNLSIDEVSAEPDLEILDNYKNYGYKHWNALGEFIDNSIGSYENNLAELKRINGPDYKLKVDITVSGNNITIKDNAAGISPEDMQRAFKTGSRPEKNSGKNEFGMGMKTSALWYTNLWKVQTSSIGDNEHKEIIFDLDKILKTRNVKLHVNRRKVDKDLHGTTIILENVRSHPKSVTKEVLVSRLASMYMSYLRNNQLSLTYMGDNINYQKPEVLKTPFTLIPIEQLNKDSLSHIDKNIINDELYRRIEDFGSPILSINWEQKITNFFEAEDGSIIRYSGYLSLLKTTTEGDNVIRLFRRKRAIVNAYRPHSIFGKDGSISSNRIFGEIHIEDLPVTYNKDNFLWGNNESLFLKSLISYLNSENCIPILKQAKLYRKKNDPERGIEVRNKYVEKYKEKYSNEEYKKQVSSILEHSKESIEEPKNHSNLERSDELLNVDFNSDTYKVYLQFYQGSKLDRLFYIDNHAELPSDIDIHGECIGIRINTQHPYIMKISESQEEVLFQFIKNYAVAVFFAENQNYSLEDFISMTSFNLSDLMKLESKI